MRATPKDQPEPPPLGARAGFGAAALAMVACGATFGELRMAPMLATALVVSAIYWFGDVMDRWYRARADGSPFAAGDPIWRRLALLGVSLVGVLATTFALPPTSIFALVAILLIGAFDSVEVPFLRGLYPIGGGGWYRPKRLSVIKHLMIGAWWSLLLIVGAGTVHAPGLAVAIVFALIQVTVGAAVGHLPVIAEQRRLGIRNPGTRFGVRRLLRLLKGVNAASAVLLAVAAYFDRPAAAIYLGLLVINVWRSLLFLEVGRAGVESERLRARNLATCFLFPIVCALARSFG